MKNLFILLLFPLISCGQKNHDARGRWEGKLEAFNLRIVFNVSEENGVWKATAESPDQSNDKIPTDQVTVRDNRVSITMKALNASFSGTMTSDSTLEGTFTQGGAIPLKLFKRSASPVKIKAQTPQPPFSYRSEDVIYKSEDGSIQYGATITIPNGKGPFPAAILVTGSGAQDRDERIYDHRPFAVIADHLTKNGFVVLRVDDRGVGKSTGNFATSTSADFAKDVHTGFNYLLSRSETDKKKMGIIGHSEGGLIAPLVASQRKDVDFMILLAGPGVPLVESMTEQNKAILRMSGLPEPAVVAYGELYRQFALLIAAHNDTTILRNKMSESIASWAAGVNNGILLQLGLNTPAARAEVVNSFIREATSPWYHYFMAFDPTPFLENTSAKVLALNGSRDVQVDSKLNLEGIRKALKKSKSKSFEVKEFEGLNHLFQTCIKCNTQEYGELEETIAPSVLAEMSSWLKKNVAGK